MYSLLIVEDEAIMRDGLSTTIPWGEWGFHVSGTAEDGNKALALLEENRADLVLTDIRMPGMTGIELLQEIRKRFHHTKIVLLSGYEEFEYVRQGLAYGASGYVLKMNLLTELKPAILHAKSLIDHDSEAALLHRAAEEAGHNIRQREFVRRLLLGESPDGEGAFHLTNSTLEWLPVVLYVNQYFDQMRERGAHAMNEELHGLVKSAESFLNSFERSYILVRIKENEWVATFVSDRPLGALAQVIRRRLSELMETVSLQLIAATGETGSPSDELFASYQRTRLAMFVRATPYAASRQLEPTPSSVALNASESRLLFSLEMGDRDAVNTCLREWFELWRQLQYTSIARLQESCLRFISMLAWRVKELYGEGGNIGAALVDIVRYEEVDALEAWMQTRIEKLLEQVSAIHSCETEERISRIIAYISANVNEKITLKQMAEFVYLNPSYLSVVFKEQTGKSFTDYVIEAKVRKASNYLAEGMKVKQAAEMVGYEDLKHFRKMFQKFIGANPGDYR